jgi:hypothetical protein
MTKAREILKNIAINVEHQGDDAVGYISKEEVDLALSSLRSMVMGMRKDCKHTPPQMSYCCPTCDKNDLIEAIADEMFGEEYDKPENYRCKCGQAWDNHDPDKCGAYKPPDFSTHGKAGESRKKLRGMG